MIFSKYFLSAFAFVIAAGGAVGSVFDSFDFIVTSNSLGLAPNDRNIEQVMSLGISCNKSNYGSICLAFTSGGTLVPTYSTFNETRYGASSFWQRTP